MEQLTTMRPWTGIAGDLEYELVKKAVFSLVKGMDLQQLADYGYAVMGNPFYLVCDGLLVYSPHQPSPTVSSFLDMIRNTAPVCSEALYMLTSDQYRQLRHEIDAPILIDCAHLGLRLLTAKVVYQGENVAELEILESERVFDESDGLYLQAFASYISQCLQDENSELFTALFFRQRLAGILSGEPYLARSLPLPSDTADLPAYMVCVSLAEDAADDFLNQHGGNQDGLYFAKCVAFDGCVVYLCIPSSREQKEKIWAFFSALADEGTLVGISAPFTDRQAIVKHYYQAKKMVELAGSIDTGEKLMYFPQHLVDAFLLDASRHNHIGNYLDRRFYRLRSEDKKRGGIYAQTLQAYFESGANLQKASQLLGLHRNSLTKRLRKIEGLLGCSIVEGDNLFECMFMEKLAKLTESMEGLDIEEIDI